MNYLSKLLPNNLLVINKWFSLRNVSISRLNFFTRGSRNGDTVMWPMENLWVASTAVNCCLSLWLLGHNVDLVNASDVKRSYCLKPFGYPATSHCRSSKWKLQGTQKLGWAPNTNKAEFTVYTANYKIQAVHMCAGTSATCVGVFFFFFLQNTSTYTILLISKPRIWIQGWRYCEERASIS